MSVAHTEPEVHQEDDIVRSQTLTVIGLSGLFVMLLAIFVAGAFLHVRAGSVRSHAEPSSLHTRRAPLEIGIVDQTPIETFRYGLRLRAAQRTQLERYGWVDRAHGIARIPIERAMDLVLSEQASPTNGGTPR